jgi:hypothetical protein
MGTWGNLEVLRMQVFLQITPDIFRLLENTSELYILQRKEAGLTA